MNQPHRQQNIFELKMDLYVRFRFIGLFKYTNIEQIYIK